MSEDVTSTSVRITNLRCPRCQGCNVVSRAKAASGSFLQLGRTGQYTVRCRASSFTVATSMLKFKLGYA